MWMAPCLQPPGNLHIASLEVVFCECKAADFVRTMREHVLEHHRTSPLDAVIIETSGLVDPEAIGLLLDHHGLSEQFTLCRIVTIVAPSHFLRLLANLPVVEKQILTSNHILINQIDTVDQPTLESVEIAVRQINPNAEIVRTEFCRSDFSLAVPLTNPPQGRLSTCDANPFSTTELIWPAHRPLEDMCTLLKNLPDTILCVKGCAVTLTGGYRVERTVDTCEIQPQLSCDLAQVTLVVLAHDDHADDLQELQKQWRCL